MARKKKIQINEAEISTNAETESAASASSIGNDNDVGEYKFDAPKSFAEIQEQKESPEVQENDGVKSDAPLDVDALLKEFSEPVLDEKRKKRGRKPKEAEPVKTQFIIPGKLFVTVCDNTLVGTVGLLDSLISDKPIDTNLIRLQPDQIDQLAPLAEEAIKAMKLENDPISVYFGSLAAIYISNYLTLKTYIMKQEYAKKNKG